MARLEEPLVRGGAAGQAKQKTRMWFGYYPLWQETVPLTPTGQVDTVRVVANIMAGFIIGIRQTLSAIVSATLVFTATSNPIVNDMFPFGISMMWWSTVAGSAFYGIFGRLQYNTNATQEVCAILYGAMASKAASQLQHKPESIQPTILALIAVGTVLTGVGSFLFGKVGLGRLMLSFPTPVTSGFLGTIGFFLVKQALQITSGVEWSYFWPKSLSAFLAPRSSMPMICLGAMVMFMRRGPGMLNVMFPTNKIIKWLGGLICQLLPLGVFYAVVGVLGVSLDDVTDGGWTYPAQAPESFTSLWTTYNWADADWAVVLSNVPSMGSLVLMSTLCTMTGVLGIVGKFPSGPDGDPSPDDVVDFDGELATVGVGAILTGLTNGVVTFHRLGSSVQLRMDGGTHRVAVMSSACFVGIFFFSSVPLGHYIPKFYLGGLFAGSGISFLEGVFFSYRSMPSSKVKLFGSQLPTAQYYVALTCIIVAAFSSPFEGIGAGLVLTLLLFLIRSAASSPVSSASDGRNTMSRTMRPIWELKFLRSEGDKIAILYLQGQLFFGSGQNLASIIAQTVEVRPGLKHCILSFAKVPAIDVSAVDFLKGAQKKLKRRGCKLIFCRMRPSVFAALSAAELITSPDSDLRAVLERSLDDADDVVSQSGTTEVPVPALEHDLGIHPGTEVLRTLRRESSFKPLRLGDHDGFDHETDALDYCADQLLGELFYAAGRKLEPHLMRYRECYDLGAGLDEGTFEKISGLAPGTMKELRPYCQLWQDCTPKAVLRDNNALYFVLKGALSMVDVDDLPLESEAEGCESPDVIGLPSRHSLPDMLHVDKKGFHGRGGKRLRKRYPPGTVVGKAPFALRLAGRLLDEHIMSEIVVSGKFGSSTDILVLQGGDWPQLPAALQKALSDLLITQLAEERQHTLLCGE